MSAGDGEALVVLVTGASSGIGNAIATRLAKRGDRVYGTSRAPASHARRADEFFELLAMDLSEPGSVEAAVATVLGREGRLDLLVCNAGAGVAGSVEECSEGEAALQMEVNFLGTLRCVKAVLPSMRAAGAGRIIVVSSMAGLIGMPFQAFYSASKHALEGLVESLRYEIRPFGVEACLLEPGDFRTGFTASRRVAAAYAAAPAASPYAPYHEAAMAVQERDEAAGHDPLEVARLVEVLARAPRLQVRYTVGPAFERFACWAKHYLPDFAFEFLYRKYYRLP